MNRADITIRVFGVYLACLGIALLIAPNLLLATFGVAQTTEVWIRVVGMLALVLSYYYWEAGRRQVTAFFAWTVPARIGVLVFFCVFAVLDLAPPVLILFGAVDALGGVWTGLALHRERVGRASEVTGGRQAY